MNNYHGTKMRRQADDRKKRYRHLRLVGGKAEYLTEEEYLSKTTVFSTQGISPAKPQQKGYRKGGWY